MTTSWNKCEGIKKIYFSTLDFPINELSFHFDLLNLVWENSKVIGSSCIKNN